MKYEIVNEAFLKRFGDSVLKMGVQIFCTVCEQPIVLNNGVTFPAHGLNLCADCVKKLGEELDRGN